MTASIPQKKNSLQNDLFAAGFDICHAFHPSSYNEHIKKHSLPLVPLSCIEKSKAYLIGNTKHLWPIFIRWYNSNKDLDSDSDSDSNSNSDSDTNQPSNNRKNPDNPLDTYCQINIDDILKAHFPPSPSSSYQVYWSCESCADRIVSMQRVASCSGLSYLDSKSHLTIHPVYGTWHSFRAVVVVVDVGENTRAEQTVRAAELGGAVGVHGGIIPRAPPPLTPTPTPVPRLSSPMEEREAGAALTRALKLSSGSDDDGGAMDRLCEQLHGRGPSERIAAAWIEVRDCISLGKEYRFDHDQLWYHYTKDVKYLLSGR